MPEVMSVKAARYIASQYQSSGCIGRTFAAFASGCRVSYEDFMSEIDMTIQECGFEAHEDMELLRSFAVDTDAPVWRD